MAEIAKFHVLIEERRRNQNYEPPIRDAAGSIVLAMPSGAEFEYGPVTDAYIDSDQVVAGLLRSLADKLDPPKEPSRY